MVTLAKSVSLSLGVLQIIVLIIITPPSLVEADALFFDFLPRLFGMRGQPIRTNSAVRPTYGAPSSFNVPPMGHSGSSWRPLYTPAEGPLRPPPVENTGGRRPAWDIFGLFSSSANKQKPLYRFPAPATGTARPRPSYTTKQAKPPFRYRPRPISVPSSTVGGNVPTYFPTLPTTTTRRPTRGPNPFYGPPRWPSSSNSGPTTTVSSDDDTYGAPQAAPITAPPVQTIATTTKGTIDSNYGAPQAGTTSRPFQFPATTRPSRPATPSSDDAIVIDVDLDGEESSGRGFADPEPSTTGDGWVPMPMAMIMEMFSWPQKSETGTNDQKNINALPATSTKTSPPTASKDFSFSTVKDSVIQVAPLDVVNGPPQYSQSVPTQSTAPPTKDTESTSGETVTPSTMTLQGNTVWVLMKNDTEDSVTKDPDQEDRTEVPLLPTEPKAEDGETAEELAENASRAGKAVGFNPTSDNPISSSPPPNGLNTFVSLALHDDETDSTLGVPTEAITEHPDYAYDVFYSR